VEVSVKAPAILFVVAALLAGGHLATRLLGLAEHTAVLAGMPLDDRSWVLGPLHVALYFLAVVVAPVLVLAASAETAVRLVAQARARSTIASRQPEISAMTSGDGT
jgi:hypothetical protein